MRTVALTTLVKIELPTRTIRYCEGGFFRWGGELFRSRDEVFGLVSSASELSEGVGEEVSVFELAFSPPGTTPPAQLSQPGYQTSVAQFFVGEYDTETGALIGPPTEEFIGELDQTAIEFGADSRTVEMTIVAESARLMERNIGNSLNAAWHRSIHPGEAGHDQGTGLGRQLAWGVEGARYGGSGGGGGGGGFGLDPSRVRQN